jgi:hypothetical protein
MRTMVTTVLLASAIASAALCGDADFQWQGQLASGQLLEIRGVNGSIHAEGTADHTASVTAHKTGNNNDPAGVSVQAVVFDGGVVVCALYPDSDSRPPNVCGAPHMDTYLSANNNDVQVEFTVKVPQGVLFSARTINGDIQATAMTAHADAGTLMGNIMITTTRSAQASTLHGSIGAIIGTTLWNGVQAFDAGFGNIDLQIPSDANVDVHAMAFRGAIVSDFPLDITMEGNSTMARGTLGSGGRSLKLSTFSGNITLHQGPASSQ